MSEDGTRRRGLGRGLRGRSRRRGLIDFRQILVGNSSGGSDRWSLGGTKPFQEPDPSLLLG